MREIKSLDEIKSIELGIMKKIHRFCIEKNVTYYLSHGSLIGAIRHKGFIPWDDDIDIFMPREEYCRFCQIFSAYAKEQQLELVNSETPVFFGRPMSKVVDTRTVLVESDYEGDDPIGVFVDIWPLDGMPVNKMLRKLHKYKCSIYLKLFYGNVTRPDRTKTLKKKLLHKAGCLCSRDNLLRKILHESQKYLFKSSEYVSCYVDPYQAEMKNCWFGTPILIRFEDAEFFVPNDYDNVLKCLYGKYMQLPPKEKQIPHHVVDTYWK